MGIKDNSSQSVLSKISMILAFLLILAAIYWGYVQVEQYRLKDDPMLDELRETFDDFFSNHKKWKGNLSPLNERSIMDEIEIFRGSTSHTINKSKVFLCLKDEKNEYYSKNMLIYVLAHELSHVISTSIGHTPEFHSIFEELLVELTDSDKYDPSEEILLDYCKDGDNLE